MRRLIISLALCYCGLGATIYAQTDIFERTTYSVGRSIIDEYLPEGFAYDPVTFLFNTPIYSFGAFTLYGETQFTQAFNTLKRVVDYEFGWNGGIRYQTHLAKHLQLTAAIGSGPHYISVETRNQANGFIFSDNFELGFTYAFPTADTLLHMKGRFRHVSNAGLKLPNYGIDNLFLVIGLGSIF